MSSLWTDRILNVGEQTVISLPRNGEPFNKTAFCTESASVNST
jgi:hypothetical protein